MPITNKQIHDELKDLKEDVRFTVVNAEFRIYYIDLRVQFYCV